MWLFSEFSRTHRHFFHENPRISDVKGTTKKAEALELFVYPNSVKRYQNRQEKRAFLKQPIRFLYRLLQCFFRLSSVKIYFSIVAFQKTPVSLENLNHFSGHHPLTPLRHFGNFSLTVFLKKLKKEQFDCSYFCDSRYIYIYKHAGLQVSKALKMNGISVLMGGFKGGTPPPL